MEPDGISDIEGKVATVATSKLGNERVSNSTSALSALVVHRRLVVARRAALLIGSKSTVSSLKAVKALTRTWSEQVSD
jgi:hypothetical protein